MQYPVKCFAEIDVHLIYVGFFSQDVTYRGLHCLFCHHLFCIFIIRDPVNQGQKGQQFGQKENSWITLRTTLGQKWFFLGPNLAIFGCFNQSPLALHVTAVNAATKQPRHEVRVSTRLGENIWLHIKQEFQCICSIKGVIAIHILKSTTFKKSFKWNLHRIIMKWANLIRYFNN